MMSDDRIIECARHGSSRATFVCGHAARGTERGFHFERSLDDPWPDAYCDACARVVERDGAWTDENQAAADLKLLCGSCWEECFAREAGEAPPDVQQRHLRAALDRASRRQATFLERTQLARFPRYFWDQPSGAFELRDAGERPHWRARFLIAGSWSRRSGTFLWGWANDSLDRRCTAPVVQVKRDGEQKLIPRLWRALQSCTEPEAIDLWIAAGDALEADGLYQCPHDDSIIYLLLFGAQPVS